MINRRTFLSCGAGVSRQRTVANKVILDAVGGLLQQRGRATFAFASAAPACGPSQATLLQRYSGRESRLRAAAEQLKIGCREATTCGAIARAVGDVTLAHAVSTSMGQNTIPLLVPCHRVLGANGTPVGFSAPGVVTSKMKPLAPERPAARTGQYAFGF